MEVAGKAEMIMASALGFRRDQVRRPDRDALASIAFRRAGAGFGGADIHVDDGGRTPGGVLPAVDIAGEVSGFRE
jgi:hypothetical protein